MAAPIMFFSVVILLDHQRYTCAAAVVLLMAGFAAATLAVPSVHARYGLEIPSLSFSNMPVHRERATNNADA